MRGCSRSLRTGWVGPLVFLALSLFAASILVACGRADDVPAPEVRAQEINQSVMCPVCPGESIDQSQHPLAIQMRGIVVEKLGQGWTADQIRAHFVDGYGSSVLLEPPRSGFNLTVWVVPPVAVVLAGGLLFLVLRSMARPLPNGAGTSELTEEERVAYFARIEAVESADDPGSADGTPSEQQRGSVG